MRCPGPPAGPRCPEAPRCHRGARVRPLTIHSHSLGPFSTCVRLIFYILTGVLFWFCLLKPHVRRRNELSPWSKAHRLYQPRHGSLLRTFFFFNLFTPSPISFFSSYHACDSVCPTHLYFHLYQARYWYYCVPIYNNNNNLRCSFVHISLSPHFFPGRVLSS